MQADEAATVFLAWATSIGAYNPEWQPPIDGQVDFSVIVPRTPEGEVLLKAKQVAEVGINGVDNKIIVFTKKASPISQKALAKMPRSVDGVDVVYRQGVVQPISEGIVAPSAGPTHRVRVVGGASHYCCGSSISPGNVRETGTLGCLVRDGVGKLYGLSNNHVSGSCSYAGVGLPILAPGVTDVAPGCYKPFTIGYHARSLPLVAGNPDNVPIADNTDAAMFEIADESSVSSFQGDAYDTPANVIDPTPNLLVQKVGRTSALTEGRVLSVLHGPVAIPYNASIAGFSGLVFLESLYVVTGVGTQFVAAGDSGSLVTHVDATGERKAVGIVVGNMADGSAIGKLNGLILPLQPILNRFGVTLVTGHNL